MAEKQQTAGSETPHEFVAQQLDWDRVGHLVLLSRALDELEESELAPSGEIPYQFSAKGHELAQVLLALSLDHPHDAAGVYYRSRPFMLARLSEGDELTLVTWGAMVYLSLEAAARFEGRVEVLDLRTISPWDQEGVIAAVRKTGRYDGPGTLPKIRANASGRACDMTNLEHYQKLERMYLARM